MNKEFDALSDERARLFYRNLAIVERLRTMNNELSSNPFKRARQKFENQSELSTLMAESGRNQSEIERLAKAMDALLAQQIDQSSKSGPDSPKSGPPKSSSTSLAEALEDLVAMHQAGQLNAEEFQTAKSKILAGDRPK